MMMGFLSDSNEWMARRVESSRNPLLTSLVPHRMLPVAIATLISISSACGAHTHTHNWQLIPRRTPPDALLFLSLLHSPILHPVFFSFFFLSFLLLFSFPFLFIFFFYSSSATFFYYYSPPIQICLPFKWLNDVPSFVHSLPSMFFHPFPCACVSLSVFSRLFRWKNNNRHVIKAQQRTHTHTLLIPLLFQYQIDYYTTTYSLRLARFLMQFSSCICRLHNSWNCRRE